MYQNIENNEFKKLMAQPNTVALDVRTPREINEGYIAGTHHFIDIHDETFEADIAKLDPSKNYLVYCRSGARSAMACRVMYEKGFKGQLYNLAKGIIGWDGEIISR
jgi:rhodanese-related sulfurtransferase